MNRRASTPEDQRAAGQPVGIVDRTQTPVVILGTHHIGVST